jgi:hypothetical protein
MIQVPYKINDHDEHDGAFDAVQWCIQTLGCKGPTTLIHFLRYGADLDPILIWQYDLHNFYFKDEDIAMQFKLTWL